jgi:hypothetical protein
LSNDVITAGTYDSIKNLDVITFSDLVLLKVTITSFNYQMKTLTLRVEQVYDVAHGQYPTYADTSHLSKAVLVE